jgi:hypothetical protein
VNTLLVSALGAALVSAAFLAGATWAASGAETGTQEVTVYSGSTAVTLPAAVAAAAPAMAEAQAGPDRDARAPLRHVRVVLQAPGAGN